jgi:hypothetical protein
MSEPLSAIVKTGGDFITRFAGGGTIATGQTGLLLTLDPPSGQRVRLTHLSTTAGAAQSGISVLLGSDTVIDEMELDGDTPNQAANFSVGKYQPYAAGNPPMTNYHQFTGKTGEDLTITKNAGNTAAIIYYGYEYGL